MENKMNGPIKPLTIISAIETGVVLVFYAFGIGIGSLVQPAPTFSEVMDRYGLFFLGVPILTAGMGAILIGTGRENYIKYSTGGILLAGIVLFYAVYVRTYGAGGYL